MARTNARGRRAMWLAALGLVAVGCGGSSTDDRNLPDASPVTLPDGGADVPRLTVKESQILDPEMKPIVLRGYNWGQYQTAEEGDGPDNVADGANIVRIPLSWYFDSAGNGVQSSKQDSYDPSAEGHITPALLDSLDQQIAWAVKGKLWVIVMIRGGDDDFWTKEGVIPDFIEMWSFLAKRYKNVPNIAAYELLSEPHPPSPLDNGDVASFYKKVIASVRNVDERMPVIVGAAKDYELRDLEQVFVGPEANVIYAANFYELPAYVKQVKKSDDLTGYPGKYLDQVKATDACDTANVKKTVNMDKAFVGGLLKCVTSFRDAHHVPVFIDQIGIRSLTPDSKQYVADVLDLFRSNDVSFTYWTYRASYSKDGKGEGDIGVLYQTKDRTWHEKTDWRELISVFLKGGTTE